MQIYPSWFGRTWVPYASPWMMALNENLYTTRITQLVCLQWRLPFFIFSFNILRADSFGRRTDIQLSVWAAAWRRMSVPLWIFQLSGPPLLNIWSTPALSASPFWTIECLKILENGRIWDGETSNQLTTIFIEVFI